MFVMRGNEDDNGPMGTSSTSQHTKPVEPWHLYVEEQQVRSLIDDRRDCRRSTIRLTDHVDVALVAEHGDQSLASEHLVVDDERAHPPLGRCGHAVAGL
jgi:hypothetical protein